MRGECPLPLSVLAKSPVLQQGPVTAENRPDWSAASVLILHGLANLAFAQLPGGKRDRLGGPQLLWLVLQLMKSQLSATAWLYPKPETFPQERTGGGGNREALWIPPQFLPLTHTHTPPKVNTQEQGFSLEPRPL